MQEIDLKLFEILDDVPNTNTILNHLKGKNITHFKLFPGEYIYIAVDIEKTIRLDITKEIIDYTDEQKQELYDFLNNL